MHDLGLNQDPAGQVEAPWEEGTAQEAALRYRMVADSTYDWVYWEGPDGELRYVSPSCERITGYSPEELVENPALLQTLVLPEDQAAWAAHRHLSGEAGPGQVQFRIRARDGQIRWIEHACQPVIGKEGQFLGTRAGNRDVTERKQAEQELERYRDHLEELVAERTDELARANAALTAEVAERERAEKALKRSQERYALAQKAANVGSWDYDILIGALHWSEQIEPMFGFGRGEFAETYEAFLACVHPRDRQGVIEAVDACIEEGTDYALDHRIVWPDGTIRWVSETGDVIRDENGRAVRMMGVVQDITARKLAQQALQGARDLAEAARREEEERRREAEQRRRIAESLADVVAALNSNQSLDRVLDLIAMQARQLLNTRAVGIYRLEDQAGTLAIQAAHGLLVAYVAGANVPIGQGALKRALVSRRPVIVPDVGVALQDGEDLVLDRRRLAQAGYWANVYQALLAVPIRVLDEVYGGMLLYYGEPRAISGEEVELASLFGDQAALAIANARLREEAERAATAAERSRLARELHDAVTQALFSASLIAEALPRIWAQHPDEGRRGLEELRQLTRGASAEMRTLLLELRPAALTEKPLGELLRHLTEATAGRTRVPVSLSVEGNRPLPAKVQIALYRIAQEALNNVAKHAAASQAAVTLQSSPKQVVLTVGDDGCGFDLGDIRPDQLGVGIMHERAEKIGAMLQVESQPARGTRVAVAWPVKKERRSGD